MPDFHGVRELCCAQLCLTLCDPVNCHSPGSVRGIFQARSLELGKVRPRVFSPACAPGSAVCRHYPVPVDLCGRWFDCLPVTCGKAFLFFISWQIWIFDGPAGEGRLLRFRMGHSAPLTKIRYYGQNGQQILSASEFLLCAISLIQQVMRTKCLIFIRFGIYTFLDSDVPLSDLKIWVK